MVLLQEGETLAGSDNYLTLGRLQFTGQNPQKCGLAGAVRADQTVAMTGNELNINIFK